MIIGKKRIYELAKELNVSSKQIVDRGNKKIRYQKSHVNSRPRNQERQIRAMFSKGSKSTSQTNNGQVVLIQHAAAKSSHKSSVNTAHT